ncbi:pyridoxal phosphate-dependent transferase [Aspergillus unguis]
MGSTSNPPDLSHHINTKSKSRHPSPLKDIIRYMGQDGMISLAGGLPHPSLFPLQQAKFDCLPSACLSAGDDGPSDERVSLTLGRGSKPGDLDLTQFLQYGSGAGNKSLLALCRALTERVHSPPSEYEVLLHPGNTNAWAKVVGLLCEDNDFVLVEEYTYPSAQALWVPLGVRAVPVCADAGGIDALRLRGVLEGWDDGVRGSNPTGITISKERRREIYDVCVEFDIIIVEDDPYYFLQYPPYNPSPALTQPQPEKLSPSSFIKSLTPSFLSLDTQGRVIRLESFSKTLFPGLRLGYFITSPLFSERLLRATEVETQDPSGLSQAFVLALLERWGIDGYLAWAQQLRESYRERRDWLVGAFYKHFQVRPARESPSLPQAEGYVVFLGDKPVFSFIDPGAGMFVWTKWYFGHVQRFQDIAALGADEKDPEQAFATELWEAFASELVLLTPGSYYHPWQGREKVTTKERGAEEGTAHFRFSFATPSEEQIVQGVQRIRTVVERYW